MKRVKQLISIIMIMVIAFTGISAQNVVASNSDEQSEENGKLEMSAEAFKDFLLESINTEEEKISLLLNYNEANRVIYNIIVSENNFTGEYSGVLTLKGNDITKEISSIVISGKGDVIEANYLMTLIAKSIHPSYEQDWYVNTPGGIKKDNEWFSFSTEKENNDWKGILTFNKVITFEDLKTDLASAEDLKEKTSGEFTENTDADTTSSKVFEAYTTATTLTKDHMNKNADGSWSYDGVDFVVEDCDWINNSLNAEGTINQGAFYRKQAYLLAGSMMGVPYDKAAERILGYIPESKEEWAAKYDDLSTYIVLEDCFTAIMKRFSQLGSIDGSFDFDNGNYSLAINDLNKCAEELGISQEMLGWILAELEEYGVNSSINATSYSMTTGEIYTNQEEEIVENDSTDNILKIENQQFNMSCDDLMSYFENEFHEADLSYQITRQDDGSNTSRAVYCISGVYQEGEDPADVVIFLDGTDVNQSVDAIGLAGYLSSYKYTTYIAAILLVSIMDESIRSGGAYNSALLEMGKENGTTETELFTISSSIQDEEYWVISIQPK